MVVFPNAKINLGLNVVERRPDGYHNIESLMVPIPSFDVLEIIEANDGKDTLRCTGRGVDCQMEKNLVYKAVVKMRQRFGIPTVDINLNKQTPDGAGLGGGSSDAAFTLKLLNEMFACGAEDESLAEIAGEIGADCPFFIYNRPMLCSGTGTTMVPYNLQFPDGLWILLLKPDVSVPTKEAYTGLTPKFPEYSLTETLNLPIEEWQGRLTNDFERSVFARYPQLAELKQGMLEAGAVYASMSGSGSTVFGLFKRELSPDEIKQLSPECCYLFSKMS